MILGEGRQTAGTAAILDDLFRRAGVRHPDAVALADPPNREDFTDGCRRILTYAQVDLAISALAARLRGLGLRTDNPVAVQLPNTVESVIAFLGVLRAGMIAVPIPLLWRQQDIVTALGRIGTKAIVTCARVGTVPHADIAMRAAVDLFSIRHLCGFGNNLPDGLVPLDDIFSTDCSGLPPGPVRPEAAAAHVAAVTFDLDGKGLVPVARNHTELIAGGLEIFLETDLRTDTPLLSTIPISSFAGIALTLLPWLLSGGALHLHHGFDPETFAAQCRELAEVTLTLPAAVIAAAAEADMLNDAETIVALWRAPERLTTATAWQGSPILVDVASFGEIGLVAARRGADGMPGPIPHGFADTSHRSLGAPKVIETARTGNGTLALRGRMVPTQAFPPGTEPGQLPHLASDRAGYVDTGFACKADRNRQALTVTAPPPGMTTVGGYRFRQKDVDELIAQEEAEATIVALPDADLGQRLAGTSVSWENLYAKLQTRGINPLIAKAFQPVAARKLRSLAVLLTGC